MPKGRAVGGPDGGAGVGDNYGTNLHPTTPWQNFVPEAILPQPRQYTEDFSDQYESTTEFASSRVPIRVLHGPGKCSGTIIYAKVFNGYLVVVYLFGWGKLKSITNIKIGGKTQAEISPAYWHLYDGSQAPFSAVDTEMAAREPKWLSCLPKMAYLVVKFKKPTDEVPYVDWKNLECDYEGLYCRDHRADPTLVTRYYTTNNALIRSDIWTNKHYGYKRADAKVDWATVDTAANDCDELISGQVRFRMGSRFETQRTVDVIEEQMRLHAQMFDGINAAGQYQMFVDKVRAASDVVLTDQGADRNIVTAKLRGKEPNECPNRITFNFTNSAKEYKPDAVATEKIGIGTGLVPDVVSATYDTPWCLDWYIAKNLSIWAYNRSNIFGMDEEAEIETFYRGGVRCVPGLIITVTSRALAWVDQLAIVRTVSRNGLGWKIAVEPYSALIYSNAALAEGTVINQPVTEEKYPVPNPTSVTLSEYTPSGENTVLLLCEFVPADYAFIQDHVVKVTRTKIGEPTTTFETHAIKGPAVIPRTPDTATYTATVYTVNVDGVRSSGANSADISGIVFTLNNEFQGVPSAFDGSSPDLSSANGLITVVDGATDVTALATYSAVIATGCTGTVNTAVNVPVAGQPKGYYRVTAMASDTATLDIPVTYGVVSEVLRFTLVKSKQGLNAKTLNVIADRQLISYDASGALNPSTQLTTFTVNKQNTTAVVTWTATKVDGTVITPVTNLLSAATGDTVTMSAANFTTQRGAAEGVIVIATLTDGVTISDRISIVKVQTGASGAASPLTLIANGAAGIVFGPNSAGKSGGTNNNWGDGGCYSSENHVNGVFVSAKAANLTNNAMFGLNSDPTTDASYISIDYAFYFNASTLSIRESGVHILTCGAYTTSTVASITYDGQNVRYYMDGVLQRTVARAIGAALSFDSAFYTDTVSAQIVDIKFGPFVQSDQSASPAPISAGSITFTEVLTQQVGAWLSHGRITFVWPTSTVAMEAVEIWITVGGVSRYWFEVPYPSIVGQSPFMQIGSYTLTFYVRSRYGAKSTGVTAVATIVGVTDTLPVMAAIGGRLVVGASTNLAADLTSVATTISVDSNVFANGDRVLLQSVVAGVQQTEYLAITSVSSGTGPYTYTVTRNLDGSGANSWIRNDRIVSLGQTGNSFIDIYSVAGLKSAAEVGPSMVGNIRNSATYNDWTPRWAIGNLNGLYGYATNIYGAAFGVPTGAWIKIDPTNGIRIGHNVTTNIAIDAAGNASFSGTITAGTISGWTIGATSITGGNATLHSSGYLLLGTSNDIARLDAADATYRLWIGNATASSAPFRVTKAGALTAKSGDIGGWDIGTATISSGNVTLSTASSGRIAIVTSGTVGYGVSGTKFYADGTGKFSLGDKFLWDGTDIEIRSFNTWIGSWGISIAQNGVRGYLFSSGGSNIGGLYATSTTFIIQKIGETGSFVFGANELTINASNVRLAGSTAWVRASEFRDGNGVKVVSSQGAAVADATDAASAITQLNALLARLRSHGLINT